MLKILEFVTIPEGNSLMGSNPKIDFETKYTEEPQHEIWLPTYQVQKTPITVKQWMRFIHETNYPWNRHDDLEKVSPGLEYPATFISWFDATQFTSWLCDISRKPYALPTEAQWEKACRGQQGQLYPWGNEEMLSWEDELPFYSESNHPVGFRSEYESPFGCLDMWQNITEWCIDWYSDNTYANEIDMTRRNPQGPQNGIYKVLRGGNPLTSSGWPRCAYRGYQTPDYQHPNLGFRIVLNQ
jgi:formylglycine-generating enzyme required for sulfatase activity